MGPHSAVLVAAGTSAMASTSAEVTDASATHTHTAIRGTELPEPQACKATESY